MKVHYGLMLAALLLVAGACEKDSDTPACELQIATGARFFEFGHRGSDDTYIAWTSQASVIQNVEAQLALPEAERNQHINGEIQRMPTGCNLNKDWSWYFSPDNWDLAELSIELCDGNPTYVEENLEDYLDIERYCPWSSYVLREIQQPF